MQSRPILMAFLMMTLLLSGCGLFKSHKSIELTDEEMLKAEQLLAGIRAPASVNVDALPVLTPDILRNAYDENPLKAQQEYDKQWLKVRGKLVEGPRELQVERVICYVLYLEHKNKRVRCFFYGRSKMDQLAALKNGQTISVVGRYSSSSQGPSISFCSLCD